MLKDKIAYYMSGYTFKTLIDMSKAKIKIHNAENIPKGSIVFVVNHFTRIETLFLPYYIYKAINTPVWSLASYELFDGKLAKYLKLVGAVSTKAPDRDLVTVKTLLTGEAVWIVFPEGRMVKNKKIMEHGEFIIKGPRGKYRPYTGAATMALRTAFYRERMKRMQNTNPDELKRLLSLFKISPKINIEKQIFSRETYIVPVNISYYPMNSKDNIISWFAKNIVGDISNRLLEELKVEGSMLLDGTDVDIHFGKAINVNKYLNNSFIESDLSSQRAINFDDNICSKPVLKSHVFNLMNRYMALIYKMTTINIDHVFALMLKEIPYKTIEKSDFKKRIYLAVILSRTTENINFHESFKHGQTHLLTNDRLNKVQNFISQAVKAGVLQETKDTIIKDMSKLENLHEFHNIRMENPIAVMINEVEPLTPFLEYIRTIAIRTKEQIEIKLYNTLMEKSVADFEKDYYKWFKAGETKGKDVGAPFLLKGKSNEVGILLLHGYLAAPKEVKKLGEYLEKLGYYVYAPRLSGHGTSPEDLLGKTYIDWLESAEEGYTLLTTICKNVVIAGFSTGAGLALDIGARIPDIAAIIAISPPMRLKDFSVTLVPAVDIWNKLMTKVRFEKIKKVFVENNPENPHINYLRNPIAGVRELEHLMDCVISKLPDITIPIFVIQSRLDPVVNHKGTKKLFDKIGSKHKEYFLISEEKHGILIGKGSKRVFRAIGDFIDTYKPSHN